MTTNEEYKFHQYESPILINDIDNDETVVSNKFPFGKQDFKYFIGYKDDKKLDLYAYYIWLYIQDILINLNVCVL